MRNLHQIGKNPIKLSDLINEVKFSGFTSDDSIYQAATYRQFGTTTTTTTFTAPIMNYVQERCDYCMRYFAGVIVPPHTRMVVRHNPDNTHAVTYR
jgi:hypothetical protein